jgi:hypothetical protein
MIVRCIVACHGFDGPDLFFCKVECTKEDYNNGDHYIVARDKAEEEGCDGPFVVMDENDPGGRNILDKFVWESVHP